MRGIDISNHQAGLNLRKLSIDFVICKATEGIGFVDSYCDRWIQQAKALGMPWGFYHFARNNDPIAEADFFIENCIGYFGEGIPVLDIEDEGIYNWGKYADQFTKRVHERTGVWCLIYTSAGFLPYFDGYDVADNCGLWCAGYPYPASSWPDEFCPYEISPFKILTIWQFTSSLNISGYDGPLDGDMAYMDKEIWDSYAKGTKKKPVVQKNDSLVTVAFDVIKGEYGNGKERKKKLESSGYDYKTVQNYINELYAKAHRVIDGEYSNGDERVKALGDEYTVVQYIVNEILK